MGAELTVPTVTTWNERDTAAIANAGTKKHKLATGKHKRLRGTIYCDVTGTLTITFKRAATGANIDLWSKTIPIDGTNPNFTWTWDEMVRGPYVELVWTNASGGNSSDFRAFNELLPQA